MPDPRPARVVVAAIALAAAVAAYLLTGPQAIGEHDEGVYLATSRALVETGRYQLINLPSRPLQTKYPPAYPALLALVRTLLQLDPQDVRPLKAVNAMSLAAIVILAAELARRLSGGGARASVGAALLTGTSMALVTHVDLIASDLLFVAATLGALLLMDRRSLGSGIAAGCLLGGAVLARSVGLAVILGRAARFRVGRSGESLAVLGPALLITAAWAVWSTLYRSRVGPLEQYYVEYGSFVWLRVISHPAFTWRVVTGNLMEYLEMFPAVLGAPELLTTIALLVGASIGVWRSHRHHSLHDAAAMAATYMVVLVGFPYAFGRYLLPAIPIVYALVASGAQPQGGNKPTGLTTVVGSVCVALLLVANLLELRHYSQQPPDRIHVGLGQCLPFGLGGFLQTADWIRANTPIDALLASANDTAYFTLTGRRGVRPWPYEPELYDPRYGEAPPLAQVDVPEELQRLGITYIIVDPFLSDLRAYAEKHLTGILRGSGQCWTQVFASDDGLHRIYQRTPGMACTPH